MFMTGPRTSSWAFISTLTPAPRQRQRLTSRAGRTVVPSSCGSQRQEPGSQVTVPGSSCHGPPLADCLSSGVHLHRALHLLTQGGRCLMSAEPPTASGPDSDDPEGARYPNTARIWNYQL